MDQDLISYENLQVALESLKIAKWAMFFTALGALATLAAAGVALYAAKIARKEISNWKEQEKQLQLVRLKRAVFAYRQKLESLIYDVVDSAKINERFKNEMHSYLADIFNELVIAGLSNKDDVQAQLFKELVESHNKHRESAVSWGDVYEKATKLQQSINVTL
ncbi:hypothetical protein SNN58_004442 [Cronobacter dublinensis]|nr:hypothetical protein [Cronobacter dublinensis]ELY3972985.1 hypothetical protein [Cronobacter dublinensis]ELY4483430.1 hypothetical protein [Cronobacter dublinensis]ELY5825824.1 hypothetical protein [Cronobacter dublinensis]